MKALFIFSLFHIISPSKYLYIFSSYYQNKVSFKLSYFSIHIKKYE